MAQAKKHILPFFIPHLGCPQQCVFCDQHKIAGQRPPTAEQVAQAIADLPVGQQADYELAFYGGSFTALPRERQEYYLEPARQALAAGRLAGVRVSTRPDCINAEVIELLRYYGVDTVELGVQSMHDMVLEKARRGHTAAQSLAALRQLQTAGLRTGVQLMPGLPGESLAECWQGARRLLAERPNMLRIYPTIVLRGTVLAQYYQQGEYLPLTLEGAANITLALKMLAEDYAVTVIRMGLQPSDELAEQVLAGPYHPAFGSLVQSLYWRHKILWALRLWPHTQTIYLVGRDISEAVGQRGQNRAYYARLAPKLALKPLPTAQNLSPGALLLQQADGVDKLLLDEDFRQKWQPEKELLK